MQKVDEKSSSSALKCLFCQGEHKLDSCNELSKKPHSKKMDFLKSKGVCFGCLSPTILHIYKNVGACKEKESNKQTITSVLVETLTGAREPDCILPIVPVRVKMKKSNRMIETYAFLDAGSTGTFCMEALLRDLKVSGKRTDILLKTMKKKKLLVPAWSLVWRFVMWMMA